MLPIGDFGAFQANILDGKSDGKSISGATAHGIYRQKVFQAARKSTNKGLFEIRDRGAWDDRKIFDFDERQVWSRPSGGRRPLADGH